MKTFLLLLSLLSGNANAYIPLSSQFQENIQAPLDFDGIQATDTTRNAIPNSRRYDGKIVYVVADQLNWQLQGGIANSNWVSVGGSTGVTSVSNSDGTLTISPTTGSVVAGLNLGNVNDWTVDQNFTQIGINTTSPTNSLTLGSTSTGIAYFETADQTTNVAKVLSSWSGTAYNTVSSASGTVTNPLALQFSVESATGNSAYRQFTIYDVTGRAGTGYGIFDFTNYSSSVAGATNALRGIYVGSSSSQQVEGMYPTVNQSGTATFSALYISPYFQTAVNTPYLLNLGTNTAANNSGTHTKKFTVDYQGNTIAAGSVSGSNLSGTNSGDVTLGAVGSSPNADAASLSGQALTLQPFSSSYPGVVAASGGGTTNFLRADGSWASPSGTGVTSITGTDGITPTTATSGAVTLGLGTNLTLGASGQNIIADSSNNLYQGAGLSTIAGISYSNFFGHYAGLSSTGASFSNFFGNQAGYGSTGGQGSNFFGPGAGEGSNGAADSNFFGSEAGASSGAGSSNFMGNAAGYGATYADNSNFFGSSAGYGATNAASSIFIGTQAGYNDTVDNNFTGRYSILIGAYSNTGGHSNSIVLGAGTNTMAHEFMIDPAITNWNFQNTSYALPTSSSIGTLVNDGSSNMTWSTVLYDSGYEESVDFSNRVLYDYESGASYPTVYFGTQGGIVPLALLDSNGVSLEWDNRFLADNGGEVSLYWNNRTLVYTDGTTVVADWGATILTDYTSGNSSIDWTNRRLYDSSGGESIAYNERLLYTQNNAFTGSNYPIINYSMDLNSYGNTLTEPAIWFTQTNATENMFFDVNGDLVLTNASSTWNNTGNGNFANGYSDSISSINIGGNYGYVSAISLGGASVNNSSGQNSFTVTYANGSGTAVNNQGGGSALFSFIYEGGDTITANSPGSVTAISAGAGGNNSVDITGEGCITAIAFQSNANNNSIGNIGGGGAGVFVSIQGTATSSNIENSSGSLIAGEINNNGSNAQLSTTDGSWTGGYIQGTDSNTIDSSGGNGAFAFGYVGGSDNIIQANDNGAMAGGSITGRNNTIAANSNGSFIWAHIDTGSGSNVEAGSDGGGIVGAWANNGSAIYTNDSGTLAGGVYADQGGTINVNAPGSQVFGEAYGSGSNMETQAQGSTVRGSAFNGYSMNAQGAGSLVSGTDNYGPSSAGGNASHLFGDNLNDNDNNYTFMFGNQIVANGTGFWVGFNGQMNIMLDISNSAFILYDIGSTSSVDVQNRYLVTGANDIAIDWQNLHLVNTGSGYTSVDWGNYLLLDAGGHNSISWENRYLYNNVGAAVVDYQNLYLTNHSGINVLSWDNFGGTGTRVVGTDYNGVFGNYGLLGQKRQVQTAAPTTGGTVTSDHSPQLIIKPTGTLATLTVVFPASPGDMDTFSIASSQTITALTLSSSYTINGGISTIVANGFATWTFSASGTLGWFRTN